MIDPAVAMSAELSQEDLGSALEERFGHWTEREALPVLCEAAEQQESDVAATRSPGSEACYAMGS